MVTRAAPQMLEAPVTLTPTKKRATRALTTTPKET